MSKILAVVTNQSTYGTNPHRTGLWIAELVHFYDRVRQAGFEVDIVSPEGGQVPLDPRSVRLADKEVRKYMNDRAFMSSLDHTRKAADVDPAEYAAIFYTGGHGVMWDFPGSAALQQVARDIYENGGVVSSVCHGACGLLNITLSDGSLLVEGRTVTGFSTAEERVAMVKSRVPFLVEDEFRKRGANYVKATIPMTPFATADGRLVTGQNPVSTKVVTAKIIETLRQL
ncbi:MULTISPECIES: type 1 glutamine amidotransferase domain-containing protein [Streptomyces]|jgi:putative intracellular protease/amidase|uniref:Intracellular protease/amidase n=1 Tax=Streptomyces collinus TaxID=42684 RepID=A0AA89Q8G9_STRCU|nr:MULTISPECIES: type 1 glutamine amidotransferase domain-containing protein [Streptomyces]MBB5816307.1 putative intracellular protease/amidase [Streptomyces collinus]MDC0771751.1 type 1 glutamine amidotransferase domain-containing protein [Streptomyces sp. HD]PBC92511.1 putative intracellular protease/amidase [Streptomyces sp. Ag82_O1-15]RPF31030.1 putative intracellular protease/amidase [Streptomyces sp. TLI_185]WMX69128.1 type 1 glutamine amidotransferase domain-containing protein [Streptom